MIKSINSVIKMLTEQALELYDSAFDSEDDGCWKSASAKLSLVTEQLAAIRGTNDDHEFIRVQRLYNMRKRKGVLY